MSEKEFELYLSLLSRFLRLSPAQRDEIADELRDHLQERLSELTSEGVSREDAVRRALEEFGDAAGLAHHFTRIAQKRKRRLIMRCTFGSVAALAAAMLITSAFWPETPNGQVNREAVAQVTTESAVQATPEEKREPVAETWLSKVDQRNAELDAKLESLTDYTFLDTPLREALHYIGEYHKMNVVISDANLQDEGISPDDEVVNLDVRGITLRTALELMLHPKGLAYRIHDGILHVDTQLYTAEYFEVRVYNCRDLVATTTATNRRPAVTDGARQSARDRRGDDEEEERHLSANGRGMRRGGGFGVIGGRRLRAAAAESRADAGDLIEVVESLTSGPWEKTDGEGGTIAVFNGLLIVRQNQAIHREIKELLERLRAAEALAAAEAEQHGEIGEEEIEIPEEINDASEENERVELPEVEEIGEGEEEK